MSACALPLSGTIEGTMTDTSDAAEEGAAVRLFSFSGLVWVNRLEQPLSLFTVSSILPKENGMPVERACLSGGIENTTNTQNFGHVRLRFGTQDISSKIHICNTIREKKIMHVCLLVRHKRARVQHRSCSLFFVREWTGLLKLHKT